ncbi:AAA family ATPase [Pseudomonas sp. NPDC089758]|uniref:AAA family ATPase n=1 Tax=Pseudomonas sp. NPDC089758 TaxID=3364473 RepID=UPI0037F47C0C
MDYYIRRVTIQDLFESKNDYKIDLTEGCNCIYGGNGTGKTTIINLIVSCLNAEIDRIAKTPFSTISIHLAKSKQIRPASFLKVTRNQDISGTVISYEIFNEESKTFIISPRARSNEISNELTDSLKHKIFKYINLTHVPLLRMHDSELFGLRDERDEFLHSMLRTRNLSSSQINEILDPSVRVLTSLQRQFIAEANEARKVITGKLETLKSKILEKVMIDDALAQRASKTIGQVSKALHTKVEDVDVSAHIKKFKDAQVSIPEEKIREHFVTWKKLNDNVRDSYAAMDTLREHAKESESDNKKFQQSLERFNNSYFALLAMTTFNDRFLSITEDVEKMQFEKLEATKSFRDYENEVNSYFQPKKIFNINEDGVFSVKSNKRTVELSDLSSGEKHILTILGKAALSRQDGAVFIADEPELSLHLDWQRMIMPSIIRLSPKSQIIVATHSPAINARGANEIDLEECR